MYFPAVFSCVPFREPKEREGRSAINACPVNSKNGKDTVKVLKMGLVIMYPAFMRNLKSSGKRERRKAGFMRLDTLFFAGAVLATIISLFL